MVDLMADGLAQRLASLVSAVFRRHSFSGRLWRVHTPCARVIEGKAHGHKSIDRGYPLALQECYEECSKRDWSKKMNINEQKAMLQRFMESKMSGRPRIPQEVVELQRLGLVDKKGEKLTPEGEKLYTS
ncbi:MAG: hypothetical protein ACLQVG_02165 [Terriglobia bacterium]